MFCAMMNYIHVIPFKCDTVISGEKEFQCMLVIVFIDKQYIGIFFLLVLR